MMKGSNSRFSHRPGKRYSNLAHVMGGMVTDADSKESGEIHQARGEAANLATMASGVPAADGAVAIVGALPKLKEGSIVAEGKQGYLVSASGNVPANGNDLYKDQADLPLGPDFLEQALLYADLWERPVFASEDNYLTDAGLHGAETSYRTRTMTQIKSFPINDVSEVPGVLELMKKHEGQFARSGNATAVLKPKNTDIAIDDCDPCADQISVAQTLPNALFRCEVVRVERKADGTVESVQIAWSFENAEAIADVSVVSDSSARETFAGRKSAYEFFSLSTDAQIGRFDPGHFAERPVFSDKLTEVPDILPGSHSDQAFTHIRRWDGVAEAVIGSSEIKNQIGTDKLVFKSNKLVLTTDFFSLEFTVAGKEILAGDYWLVEVRRYATELDRLLLVGAVDDVALPVGIKHHFCPLFVSKNGDSVEMSDAMQRQMSFPALSDIPATHVSFENDCPHIFQSAENVQEALQSLCDLSAGQIRFNNNCDQLYGPANDVQEALDQLCNLSANQVAFEPPANCERFAGTNTVADALGRLCRIEDNSSLALVLCNMMDWGVICGLRVSRVKSEKSVVFVTKGSMLDRSGRLIEIPGGEFKLDEAKIHGDLLEIQKDQEFICLSVAVSDGGELSLHLSNQSLAFGPGNLTFIEQVEACIKRKSRLRFGEFFRKLTEEESKVFGDVVNVWRHRKTLEGNVPMTSNERIIAKRVNDAMLASYKEEAPEKAKEVAQVWKRLEVELDPDKVRGDARAKRRMQLEAIKTAALGNSQEQHRLECQCESALPLCPTKPKTGPHLVPVAAIKLETFNPGNIQISEVCDLLCRKQSMNWRSFRYYFGDLIAVELEKKVKLCCEEKQPPTTGGVSGWVRDFSDLLEQPPARIPRDPPPKEPDIPPKYWPPITVRDPGLVRGDDLTFSAKLEETDGLINYRPEVEKLAVRDAEDVLTGNGYQLVETFAIDEVNPLDVMAKYSPDGKAAPLITRKPRPGDKVVLLERGGEAVDYLVVEEGDGLLPYTQKSELIQIDEKIKVALKDLKKTGVLTGAGLSGKELAEVKLKLDEVSKVTQELKFVASDDRLSERVDGFIEKLRLSETVKETIKLQLDERFAGTGGVPSTIPIGELNAFEAKLSDMIARKQEMEADIQKLTGDRNAVERDLSDLSKVAANLAESQKTTAEALANSIVELAKVEEARTSALEGIGAAKEELEFARKKQQEFVVEMRDSQPIEAVVSNERALKRLKERGVVSVGELRKLNTNKLKSILTNTGLQASSIKNIANRFVNK